MNKLHTTSNKIVQLDILRAIAIICVVIIHTSTKYATTGIEQTIGAWFSTFTRPCIAIFLFVSGYIMAKRDFLLPELRRRLKRVILPYTFFSVFAFIYRYRFQLINKYKTIALEYFIGGSFGAYYFVFIIVCVYVLYYLSNKYDVPSLYAFLFFLVLTIVHNTFFFQILQILGVKIDVFPFSLYINRYLFWPVFFYMGVYLSEKDYIANAQGNKSAVRVLWIFVFITYNILFFLGVKSDDYNSIVSTIYSFSTIMGLLSLNVPCKTFTYISGLSYYLYLSHIIVVHAIAESAKHYGILPPFWFSMIAVLLALALPIAFFEVQKRMFGRKLSILLGA